MRCNAHSSVPFSLGMLISISEILDLRGRVCMPVDHRYLVLVADIQYWGLRTELGTSLSNDIPLISLICMLDS